MSESKGKGRANGSSSSTVPASASTAGQSLASRVGASALALSRALSTLPPATQLSASSDGKLSEASTSSHIHESGNQDVGGWRSRPLAQETFRNGQADNGSTEQEFNLFAHGHPRLEGGADGQDVVHLLSQPNLSSATDTTPDFLDSEFVYDFDRTDTEYVLRQNYTLLRRLESRALIPGNTEDEEYRRGYDEWEDVLGRYIDDVWGPDVPTQDGGQQGTRTRSGVDRLKMIMKHLE